MNKLLDTTKSLATRLESRLRLQYVPSCPSTSELLRELATESSLDLPQLVCTDHQTEGRGTRGRSWLMQPGLDLAFSLAIPLTGSLEPSPRLPMALSVLVAQSLGNLIREQWRTARLYRQEDNPQPSDKASHGERVSQAINEARDSLAERICAVKWPNDLLLARPGNNGELQYSKCGGILVERIPQMLLIGIGINVNSTALEFGTELTPGLTTIRDCCGMELDREALFGGLVMRLYGKLIFNGLLKGFSRSNETAINALKASWSVLDRTAGQRWILLRDGQEIPVRASYVRFSTGLLHVSDQAGNEYVVESYAELAGA